MSIRRIFLARHGNRQDFVDPSWSTLASEPYDPPLSADGIEQARRLGDRLASEGIDSIVASPFLRTVQTAHYANAALGAPIFLEPGFGEWHVLGTLLGKLEGTLLVVGHAASVAAAALIDEQISSIECALCALFCLEHDGSRWRLSINGETTHVGARLAPFTFP